MKKIIIIGLIGLILISVATGIMLSSRQEALIYFRDYKDNREANIDKIIFEVNYTSDKMCEIDYSLEKISCKVCFEFLFEGKTENKCIYVNENDNIFTIDNLVENRVRRIISTYVEKIEYIDFPMKGREISSEFILEDLQYSCESRDIIMECDSLSSGKGTRCYYEETYKICPEGWEEA